jgi:hypothetical protein
MFKRSLVVAYVCLVGLPVLGLLDILQAGRHLTPPISVAGTWTLDADSSAVAVGHCTQVLVNMLHGAVDISAIGRSLTSYPERCSKNDDPRHGSAEDRFDDCGAPVLDRESRCEL